MCFSLTVHRYIYFHTFQGIKADINAILSVETLSLRQRSSQVRHIENKEHYLFTFSLVVSMHL